MYFLVLDTETANDIDCPLSYDLGFAVVNENNEVFAKESLVIAEIYLDRSLMTSAYYASKLPQYEIDLANGRRKMVRLATAKKMIFDYCEKFNIHYVVAHNARFDYKSMQTTQRYKTCSKYRFFFPYGVEFVDTLKMARLAMKNNDEYGAFCYENDYLTKNGRKRFTAEILYRFISKDNDFIEEHQGLADVLIEKEIFFYCLAHGVTVEDGLLWK